MAERLKPFFTRAQAASRFRSGFRELRHGRLRAVVELYVPYDVFNVTFIKSRRGRTLDSHPRRLSIDAVRGTLDLYQLDESVQGDWSCEKSNRIERQIEAASTREMLKERVSRLVLMHRRMGRFEISTTPVAYVHIPYWIGVFERGGVVTIEVVDAVRGAFEGAKLREMAEDWFRRGQ
jgi:hypothetical protein